MVREKHIRRHGGKGARERKKRETEESGEMGRQKT